ncbi:MazG-like family protein [Capnocytophaga granulosa]|uniref:MazG-like family protein n=1 Tax=Capnocytophaga granulosa TaxID=45242 RepID=UPI002051F0D3|nr:MazG-like family protein [Capnocytophaga granulosa]DAY22052.1 MAG TPA: NTP-PPase-like protein [Caudoviricetes sp.]
MKTIQELVPLIQEWAKERKIYEELTPFDELLKTHEEVGELIKACYDNDKPAIQDAIGDVMVTLINYCHFIEQDIINGIKQVFELSASELEIILLVMGVYRSLGKLISINMWEKNGELSETNGIRVFSIVYYLNNIARLENTTLEECLNIAYNEIKNRTGKMINGKFVKDER